jgi:hypothetical protein
MALVYKITRDDGLEYIGICNSKLDIRISQHSKTQRFKNRITNVIVLIKDISYEKAESVEQYFIEYYNTYNKGLNLTFNGKGKNKNTKFNTYGHVFTDESKKKMSENHRLKRGYTHSMLGKKHTETSKLKMSIMRKNKYWGTRKITKDQINEIKTAYKNLSIHIDNSKIRRLVKKNQKELVEHYSLDQLVTPNGKPLTQKILYCDYFSNLYQVSRTRIRQILDDV